MVNYGISGYKLPIMNEQELIDITLSIIGLEPTPIGTLYDQDTRQVVRYKNKQISIYPVDEMSEYIYFDILRNKDIVKSLYDYFVNKTATSGEKPIYFHIIEQYIDQPNKKIYINTKVSYPPAEEISEIISDPFELFNINLAYISSMSKIYGVDIDLSPMDTQWA